MDEHEEDKLCQEVDDFSAAKRRDVINILLLSSYRKVGIVVFLWFMARALHVWAKNQRENFLRDLHYSPRTRLIKPYLHRLENA